MIRIVLFTVLLFLLTLPVYAGHGTIRETDTEIIIEYVGDSADKKVFNVLKEEQQIIEVQQQKIEKQKEKTTETKKIVAGIHEARRAGRHIDED